MDKAKLWMIAAILIICGTTVLTSCTNDDDPVVPTDEVEAQLQKMTLREKVGQLFYVRPECLDTTIRSTLYAKCRGAWWSSVEGYRGNSFWFMRTNGYTPSSITYVCDFGYLYNQGTAVTCDDAAVLPAITIDLSKANYQTAAPVASTDVNN